VRSLSATSAGGTNVYIEANLATTEKPRSVIQATNTSHLTDPRATDDLDNNDEKTDLLDSSYKMLMCAEKMYF
jgi:hypothetical protein